MDTKQWVYVALLPSYKIFRTDVNNINVLMSPCKMSDIFVRF